MTSREGDATCLSASFLFVRASFSPAGRPEAPACCCRRHGHLQPGQAPAPAAVLPRHVCAVRSRWGGGWTICAPSGRSRGSRVAPSPIARRPRSVTAGTTSWTHGASSRRSTALGTSRRAAHGRCSTSSSPLSPSGTPSSTRTSVRGLPLERRRRRRLDVGSPWLGRKDRGGPCRSCREGGHAQVPLEAGAGSGPTDRTPSPAAAGCTMCTNLNQ